MQVLIVDDASFMRKVMKDLVEANGHDVVGEARDGDEAIKAYEMLNPDLVLMDVVMPEKSGLEAVKHIMGTDPDADRLGIAVPVNGEFKLISGNQLGVLLADYIFSTKKELGTLPSKPALIKTIVTTELQRLIAEDNSGICFDTLTGFKYIGEKIRQFEEDENGPEYLIGMEESYGYLIGTEVRDKDAVSAAVITVEMALYLKSIGKSVMQRLNEIYDKYGDREFNKVMRKKGLKRLFLHAHALKFKLPDTDEVIDVTADLDEILLGVLQAL